MAYRIRRYESGYEYIDRRNIIVALALPADEMVRQQVHESFHGFGNPEQPDGLFVLVRPGVNITNLTYPDRRPLAPTDSDWLPMSIADIAEFCADLDEPAEAGR